MPGREMLSVKGLEVSYGNKKALYPLDFTICEGEWWMLTGPNGSGKTTVVNAVTRAVPSSGELLWEGRDLRGMRSKELARHIGVLAQTRSVDAAFSVEEVVMMGRYAYPREKSGADPVEEAILSVGLQEMRRRSILNLSGGELQRVFLAQVFAQDPDLLILDEPANHLDLVYQKQIFDLLSEWIRRPGKAILPVVHDLSLALAYGHKAMLLMEGHLVSSGVVRDVLTPESLERTYNTDVYGWMRQMLEQWV